jgi:hypothetical protein
MLIKASLIHSAKSLNGYLDLQGQTKLTKQNVNDKNYLKLSKLPTPNQFTGFLLIFFNFFNFNFYFRIWISSIKSSCKI